MKWLLFLTLLAAIPCPRVAHSARRSDIGAVFTADQSPFTLIARRHEALEPLPFGAIRPEGWLETQIRANLHGFTGHLDSLAPDLIIKDDIFGKDRLTRDITKKDVGALAGGGAAAEVQYLWWNSETQGNWRDGFIRSAILTGDPEMLTRARAYIRRILSTQDPDGYLGIYDRDLRYHFDGENGELWAKTTLLRGLLAWYEFTRDPAVLTAIERAVGEEMRHYPIGTSHPFCSKTPDVGGLSHGLMLTDILESLYRLTGRTEYLDYALFLYKDFSAANLHEDAQYGKIIDPDVKLNGHGVHTYEHLRAVAAAAYASGNPALLKALDEYLHKIDGELTPSGAPAGDEWIGGRPGNATTTGYEYCSIHELMDGYIDLLGKTGVDSFGDEAERLFFNAAQGARDPEASCIAYLKTDNSYYMTGGLNTDSAGAGRQTRYKYSPVHQDVAVCCVPNAGRIAPYFVDRMWMRNRSGLVATLLGPCKVTTTWKGTPLTIREKTVYPNEFSFDFQVNANGPVKFTLAIRKPGWATGETISYPYTEEDGFYLITRTWRPGESVHLHLNADVITRTDRNNDFYFTHGPVVLARSIPATSQITRRYPLPGFYDYFYRPVNPGVYTYTGLPIEHSDNSRFEVTLFDPGQRREVNVWLTPMQGTILRQVTFPKR
ncbi:MAG TPA: beta-L-arabinofuranosidase domain-containing protein [Puia sp.]|nr:beta-L-arabinofuranosidase domain-containing protein [Puia sp.]